MVREHRLLISLITGVALLLAVISYLGEETTYTATSTLSFPDQSQDLGLIGAPVPANPTPDKLAEANARTITRPDVVRQVRRAVGGGLSTDEVEDSIEAKVDSKSNLVILEASAREAELAARLANEFARQGARATNADARARFAAAAQSLKRRVERAGDTPQAETVRVALGDQISRLESLSVLARLVTIESLAEVPGSPSSPRLIVRVVLGLIGGLVLGLLAAFLRNSLDRRLHDSNEVQTQLGLPLLAVISADALGRAANSSNGHDALPAPDSEALRILRTNLEFLKPDARLRSVVVTSPLPEEGKTTVAVGLALAAAAAGKRTLLIEGDLRRPTVSDRLELRRSPGLTDFLTGDASPKEVLQTLPAGDDTDGEGHRLVCITAGSQTTRPAELLGSDSFRTLLDEVTQAYELVIIDTSPLLPVVDTLELLPEVDGVVLCIRMQQTTRDQALAAKAALEHLPSRPTGIVATGALPRFEEGYSYYTYQYPAAPRRKESGRSS